MPVKSQPVLRNILLGVTGSIAAYKSALLIRALQEQGGYAIQVVMTENACELIGPPTLQALSKRPVYHIKQNKYDPEGMDHIKLANWADLILVAPASAHCIAKLTHGLADDLLTTLLLATRAPIVLAPAMNTAMWEHPANQANCAQLKQRGVTCIQPESGEQACGSYGIGRLPEIQTILETIDAMGMTTQQNTEPPLRILITAGPTQEPLDPIRYISNHSSGKMGYALARAAKALGCTVTLVSGPTQQIPPIGVRYIPVTTAKQMHDAVEEVFAMQDIVIGAAAISDYRPEMYTPQKRKWEADRITMTWIKNPDGLKTLTQMHKKRPFMVGFAAETEALIARANVKRIDKQLDMIAANLITDDAGFNQPENEITLLWENGQKHFPKQQKKTLAIALFNAIIEHYRTREGKQVCKTH